jgi:taurine--2-oxoglutarate transaminase
MISQTDTVTTAEREKVLKNNMDHTLFSWSKQKGLEPIAVERAEGVYLYDYSGKRYLDFSSGLMNVNIGHGNQRVTDAVIKQMQQVSYVTPACVTGIRGELGKKLADICPGDLNKVFFTLCGASSIENAIKLARIYTGRHKILARYRSFHGATYAAFSAGGDPRKLTVDEQQSPNFVHFEIPYSYRSPFPDEETTLKESIEQLERILAFEGPSNVAAILLEGESGSSGCLKLPEGYWTKLREICNRYGILLIADEGIKIHNGYGDFEKIIG